MPQSLQAQDSDWIYFAYTVDYSAVPPVPDNELTLNIKVGEAKSAVVYIDGVFVEHEYDPQTDQITVLTTGERIELWVEQPAETAGLGEISKGELLDNKKWAWSHGMDDNVALRAQMDVFDTYGVKGTLFLIGEVLDDRRDEDWIVDVPELYRRMETGWRVGSHSWSSDCGDIELASVQRSFERLQAVVAASPKPDYKVISFAAPCFIAEYHPVLLELRDSQETFAQFNLSGNDIIVNVALSADEDFQPEDIYIAPFDYDSPIGRDPSIEFDVESVTTKFDQMAGYAADGRIFWYNTLTHGGHEENIEVVLDYVVNRYGEAGTDEAWLAPADQVYSYLLVRDLSVVTTVEANGSAPLPDDERYEAHQCRRIICRLTAIAISFFTR